MLTLFIFAVLPSITLEDVFGSYSVAHAIYYEFLLGFVALLAPCRAVRPALSDRRQPLQPGAHASTCAQQVGVVNASNTVGAIIGSLITGFVLVPWLGLQTTAVGSALLNLGIGITVFYLYRSQIARWWPVPAAGVALFALGVLALPSHYYLGFRQGPSEHMVFYAEGPETTVAVFDVPEQNFKVSFVNGRIEVPTDAISMAAFRLLGHLPAILRPDATSALMMSFGNGIATGSLDTYGIERHRRRRSLRRTVQSRRNLLEREPQRPAQPSRCARTSRTHETSCSRPPSNTTSSRPTRPTRPMPVAGRSSPRSSTVRSPRTSRRTAYSSSGYPFTA